MAFKTAGEILRDQIEEHLLAGSSWVDLQDTLSRVNRGDQYVELFRQLSAVATLGRIVAFGVGLSERHALSAPEFEHEYRVYMRDTLITANQTLSDRFYR